MHLLLPGLEKLAVNCLPPCRIRDSQPVYVTQNDRIALMATFYPPPHLFKVNLAECDTSDSSVSNHSKQDKNQPKSHIHIQNHDKEQQSFIELQQHEMSEIKHQNKEPLTQKKYKYKNRRQYEGSDSEYCDLLEHLSLQGRHQISSHTSSKNMPNKDYFFQLEQKSYQSQFSPNKIDYHDKMKLQSFDGKKTKRLKGQQGLSSFKWDSQSQISFRKENRFKRIFFILNSKIASFYQDSFQGIKKQINQNDNQSISRKKTKKKKQKENDKLSKFKSNKRRKQMSRILGTSQSHSSVSL